MSEFTKYLTRDLSAQGVKVTRLDTYYHDEEETDPAKLEEIRATLKPLLKTLKPLVKNGDYSVLISEETSGRIPTLIVQDFVRAVYRENNFPPVNALFLLGHDIQEPEQQDTKSEFMRRIATIKSLYPHDIAALRMDVSPQAIQFNRKASGYQPLAPRGEIFYGMIGFGSTVGDVESDDLKGVKHEVLEVTEKGTVKHFQGIAVIHDPSTKKIVVAARKRLHTIASEVTQEILHPEPFYKKLFKRG
jgi:hypothetical protein